MMDLIPRNNCTGCGACAAVCSRQAVSMCADAEGFAYPHIDSSACVNCGRCREACPILKNMPMRTPIAVFAASSISQEVLDKSSSGGVFSILAERILGTGGTVYGAALSADVHCVRHRDVRTLSELPQLLGSKYVQSDLSGIYGKIKKDVQSGSEVLFTGTPCQVAAVRAVLGTDADKILTVEVICHAVPSPLAWEIYASEQERQAQSPLVDAKFRDKTFGWNSFGLKLAFANGCHSVRPLNEDPYLRAFLSELINRPSCHSCSFRSFRSGADMTIGDYWGMEKSFQDVVGDRGLSVILINSDMGSALFDSIRDELHVWDSNLQDAVKSNSPLVSSTTPHPKRAWFLNEMTRSAKPFGALVEQVFRPPLPRRIRIVLGRWKKAVLHNS